jgi:hypothetical protein
MSRTPRLRAHLAEKRASLIEIVGRGEGIEIGHLAVLANVRGAIAAIDAVQAEADAVALNSRQW